MNDLDDQLTPEETARRRDEVLRRMLNTPPHPHPDRRAERAVAQPYRSAASTATSAWFSPRR